MGEARVCSSVIVSAELRYGAKKRGSARLTSQLEAVLSALDVLPFETPADAEYARLRTRLERDGRPIGANDMLIAAQALAHQPRRPFAKTQCIRNQSRERRVHVQPIPVQPVAARRGFCRKLAVPLSGEHGSIGLCSPSAVTLVEAHRAMSRRLPHHELTGCRGCEAINGAGVSTVRAWERGAREPSEMARRLLEVLEREPEVFADVLVSSK